MFQSYAAPALRPLPVWRLRWQKRWVALVGLVLVAPLLALGITALRSHAQPAYQTQPVARQDLLATVTASGTVNAQNTVNVGTQVSGNISAVYVDFNSKVRQGQVLARLDPSALQAQLTQAQAALSQAQAQAAGAQASAAGSQSGISAAAANAAAQAAGARAAQAAIAAADANVVKSQSAAAVAQQTAQRDKALLAQGYIAQSQYDTDESNAVSAQSDLKSAQAAAAQSRAQAAASASTAQGGAAQTSQTAAQAAGSQDSAAAAAAAVQAAQAQVEQDQLNLQRAVITSPVDGTVIARNVSVGETVASSFQTPTLFTIAQDLKKMEVDINVGESDIGSVAPGDAVNFSVLAYPNETFHGVVSQVRVNPTTVQNVVTYTVITRVDNSSGKLLPGMTANASIVVAKAANALVVPAQALSWHPATAAKHRAQTGSTSAPRSASPWGQTANASAANLATGASGRIFVERSGKPVAIPVRIQLVSGTQLAVSALRDSLQAGDNVIISDSAATSGAAHTASRSATPGGAGGIGRALR